VTNRPVSEELRWGLLLYRTADIEVVGDDAEADPSLHSILALVPATAETVPPLGNTDATFASGSPSLAVAEPALLLLALPLRALGGAVGNANPFDTLRFSPPLRSCWNRTRRPPPPTAVSAPTFPDACRWPRSTGRNRWVAEHRPHHQLPVPTSVPFDRPKNRLPLQFSPSPATLTIVTTRPIFAPGSS
jgi:hypothetical protein